MKINALDYPWYLFCSLECLVFLARQRLEEVTRTYASANVEGDAGQQGQSRYKFHEDIHRCPFKLVCKTKRYAGTQRQI